MKKRKKGGEPFDELNTVTSAGYEKGKRRDKSINKRAGLHDKKCTEEGETRVFRRKPLAVKHKRRLRKAIPAVLAAMAIVMVILVTGSYKPPVSFEDLNGDYRTVYLEKPTDGSSPLEHTNVETIGYLNCTYQSEPYWYNEMHQNLTALFGIKQSVHTYKKSYNDNVISAEIAIGASSTARQFCVTDNLILWRDAVDPTKTDAMDTEWRDGTPTGMTREEFKKKRGLPADEFSVYVLNENTILNAEERGVVDNGDGTYSVTVDLNVNTKYGEENNIRSAVYYYKQQMAVTGGLSQLPTYKYTNITYTFNENYRVLSYVINDSYEATMRIAGLGEVTSPCTSTTTTVFDYSETASKNTIYQDVFKKYENNFGAAADETETFTVSATNCLAGAFSSVLSEGAVFNLGLELGGKPVDGVVAVSLKDGGLDGVNVKLGNISAYVSSGANGYELYLNLNQAKYKLQLGEIALPVAAAEEEDSDMLGGLLDTLMGGDFNYDKESGVATLHSVLELFGVKLDLNFAFAIDEENEEISLIDVKAGIEYGEISLPATLSFGEKSDKPADLTESDKAQYCDIMNGGVTVGANLYLGGKLVAGAVNIQLENGAFKGVCADIGGISAQYDGEYIYISLNGCKYKLSTALFGGAQTASENGGPDINAIISQIIENIKLENGNITTSLNLDILGNSQNIALAIDLFEGVRASVNLDMFGGVGVEAFLCGENAVSAELTATEKEEYVDLMNGSIPFAVDLTLDGKKISGVAQVTLKDGQLAGISAKLGDIIVYFEDNIVYASASGMDIKVPLDMLGGAASTASLDLGGFDINSLLEKITIDNGQIKAQLNFSLWEEIVADITLNVFDGISANVTTELFGAKVKVNAQLGNSDNLPKPLTQADKAKYVDISEGFSVSGMIGLTLFGQDIKLAVNNLAVSLQNSLSVKLDAVLLLNNTYNNFYIEYSEGVLTVSYGALQPLAIEEDEEEVNAGRTNDESGIITVRLDIGNGDIKALEETILQVYNRVLGVYNQVANQNVAEAGTLNEALQTLGIAKDGVKGLGELFAKLSVPTDKDGNFDLNGVLCGLLITSTQSGISAKLGNIFVELSLTDSGINAGANIRFGTSSFDLSLSEISVYSYTDIDVPCVNELDREGIADLLDYVGATADMLLQQTVSVNLNGTIYCTDEKYNGCENIKYKFDALLEYDDGGEGIPFKAVTDENGKTQVYVDNSLYIHFNLKLVAQNPAVDKNLYLDVYIMDANPSNTSNGLTTGGYTADEKGLDFYVSVSEYESGGNPLKFYGSMDEVMSIASMGVAMLNLNEINTTSKEVNSAVSTVYNLLKGMLIDNYISSTQSQFASLGKSLLPNILKKDLSTLLNGLIAQYEKLTEGVVNKQEITEGNFIKEIKCESDRLDVKLNAGTLFGNYENEDLSFYITKSAGENSLISGLGISNIYFDDKKLDLAAGISYNAVEKPDSVNGLKGYKNFAELDTLLATAVNSATHETTEEERVKGYLADYKLNSYYAVGGNVTLTLLKDIEITINTLGITIDENNDVSFNVNLSYERQTLVVPITANSATVDISIKKDMIYIRKVIEGGATSYRIMPASEFMDNMIDNLTYILSLGDFVSSVANRFTSSSTEKVFPTFDDYGDYIDKFVSLYEYKDGKWNITLNGDTLSGLAGMTGLGDISISIASDGKNLSELTLSGSLSIISFSGTLTYFNPNEKFNEGTQDYTDQIYDIVAENLPCSFAEIVGGETFAEIKKNNCWADGASYISYDGSTLAMGDYTGTCVKKDGKYYAVWTKLGDTDMTAERTSVKTGLISRDYYYTITLNSVNLYILGNPEILKELTVTGSIYGYVNNNTNYETWSDDAQHTATVSAELSYNGSAFVWTEPITFDTSDFTTSSKSHGHVSATLTIYYNGTNILGKDASGNDVTVGAHGYQKF